MEKKMIQRALELLALRSEDSPAKNLAEFLDGLAKRVEALERLHPATIVQRPEEAPAPAPTRPLQVGDRVRNAAGTDTGVVMQMAYTRGREWADVKWDSGHTAQVLYNPDTGQHCDGNQARGYGHVVLLEPDFDTQARERGYVKAEEVAEHLRELSVRTEIWGSLDLDDVFRYIDELRAQAKGAPAIPKTGDR